jgi:hypothetical protein
MVFFPTIPPLGKTCGGFSIGRAVLRYARSRFALRKGHYLTDFVSSASIALLLLNHK